MSKPNEHFSIYRIVALFVFFFAIFSLYTLRLFTLQYIHGMQYQKKAEKVASRSSIIPSQRGEIFDRHKEAPLVTNIDSFALQITPAEVPDEQWNEVFQELSVYLNIPRSKLLKKVDYSSRNYYKPVELATGLSYHKIARIAEEIEKFPGVSWSNKPIRNYLDVGSLSHIIGYVGDITQEELQIMYNKGYQSADILGKNGIEKQYDELLRGKAGYRLRTVDVRGRNIESKATREIPPELGKSLALTIDSKIQKLSEKALGDRMGSIVVLKPHNGEVLAMVSFPNYDPNLFYTEENTEAYRRFSLDSRSPFLNRSIQSAYAPASTFKVLMASAILEEEVFDPNEKILCTGEYVAGNRTFHCHKRSGHGYLNLQEALEESCNVYFFTVGREYLGVDYIVEYANMYGFGQTTGIDIPGEISGIVPSPLWKKRQFHSPWVGGDTLNYCIGQGFIGVTPLQMANMVAMVLNEGIIYKPHLLKEVLDSTTGEILWEYKPEILHQSPMSAESFNSVEEFMRGVVTDGTAKVVITTKATEAGGKTGTGQVGIKDSQTSWFISYAPYDVPVEEQVVIVVMVEATNEWEWWAPKAADIILQGIFADQSYEEAVDTLRPWYL